MCDIRSDNAVIEDQELEAIKINQDIIKRMADNALKTKHYFLIFMGAVFTFSESIQTPMLVGILIIGVIFWYVDAKYLQLERQFRAHHNAIIRGSIPYLRQFDFNPSKYKVANVFRIMFTFSEVMYPTILLATVGLTIAIRTDFLKYVRCFLQ